VLGHNKAMDLFMVFSALQDTALFHSLAFAESALSECSC